jgi:acyl-CoA thioesterase FadM
MPPALYITPTIFGSFKGQKKSFTSALASVWALNTSWIVKYKAPSGLGDTLETRLTINEIREKSVKYGFSIRKKNDVLVAEGYVVIVAANRKTGKAIDIPLDIVEKLKAFKDSARAFSDSRRTKYTA